MRYILLLFLLASQILHSQNWLPVVPGETQHYRLPDSNHITHSLLIDSVKQVGSNTIYYLNRIIRWKNIGELVALKDQGQFMGQTMTQTQDGQLVIAHEGLFLDTLIILHPSAQLGQSWLAVPESNTQATVTNVEETQFIGVTDSVKTITFSNGAVWKLSKHHGLVEAPDFQHQNAKVTLSGLETAGLGDRLYRMSDFFDYQVGDVFEYTQYSSYFTGETSYWNKSRILEKPISSPDTLEYVVEVKTKETVNGLFNHVKYYQDTVRMQYLKKDWERISSYQSEVLPIHWEGWTYVSWHNNGIIIGHPSSWNQFPGDTCPVYRTPTNPNNWLATIEGGLECFHPYEYHEVFKSGIGRTFYSYSLIDYFYTERMYGAVIQGDTVYGHISPDWVFTQTNSPSINTTLQPEPNPTTNTTFFPLPEGWKDGEILVHHLSGSLVNRQKVEQSDRISLDLSDLPNGIYLIKYQSKQGILTGKVLKM
ncbi:MAG TPA: hypothetical protein DCF33_00730 [Saprospirales bacterium]|nr:hypothetical protein [Saprospirales bacterium]